jgi:hypothetical protein
MPVKKTKKMKKDLEQGQELNEIINYWKNYNDKFFSLF